MTRRDYVAPKLPMTIMLSGNGTLSTPYKLNFQTDILAKSLIFINRNRMVKVLPQFFYNLNYLLDKLSFYKFNRQTVTDLTQIMEMLEEANEKIFGPTQTSVTLYLFENKYTRS